MKPHLSEKIQLCSVRELSPRQRLAGATLIRHAVPSYYHTLSDEAADAIIASEFGMRNTELEYGCAAIVSGDVVGICCTYPMNQLPERQYESFQNVAKALKPDEFSAFARNLRQMREGMPTIKGDGEYLAFISVAEQMRGTGLASIVLQDTVKVVEPRPLFLTVQLTNARALAFYRNNRFETVASGAHFALLCRRSAPYKNGPC